MTRIVTAVLVAGAAALLLAVPAVFGVATWKWVLAAAGLALFVAGGRRAGR